jgi:hypothetical protein
LDVSESSDLNLSTLKKLGIASMAVVWAYSGKKEHVRKSTARGSPAPSLRGFQIIRSIGGAAKDSASTAPFHPHPSLTFKTNPHSKKVM